ncbi:hypothetical protein ACFFJY_17865 [Fictibacillus aquaticus]|uniref:Lipoprotein n=1 Tax=Fictibacillus aquaticus TaxID=2021314 RepID=A0A235F5P3_9BACL|nr:hypothetical protein [Fictibacillus aquaticus]OYD56590.1 hypothetical protein CGZ90_16390 [Fictibacillus aquaticus]
MKFSRLLIFALLIGTIALSGCTFTQTKDESYIIWGENMNDRELRESLIKRLDDANLDYKIDKENNVLIKKSDMKKATMCCT